MHVVTDSSIGMLMYYGNTKAYVSVELFDGHLKGAVFVGNDAPSYVYSYVKGRGVHSFYVQHIYTTTNLQSTTDDHIECKLSRPANVCHWPSTTT